MKQVEEIKVKAFSNMMWKFLERIGAQSVSFIVQLILARILVPEEFGIIAMVNVAISICNVFITSGLGTSLIQKKNADSVDFSSVLIFNFVLSGVLYFGVYVGAPLVSKFYNNMELTPILRVLGIQLFLSAIKTVQQAYVARKMIFRKFFVATFLGTVVSGVVGVVMAYSGAGVWALVAQYLSNSFIDVCILWITIGYKFVFAFSVKRLKPLVAYGWKLLLASLINNIYENIRTLIIGKKYSSDDLAFYNRGKQIPDLICDNTIISIENILFPLMSQVQDNKSEVRQILRRFIKVSSYVMSPLMVGLAVVSDSLISILFMDKWLFCVPYVKVYCVVGLLRPMQTANQQMIKAIGRSDITVVLEIIKKTLGVIILLVAMRYGVLWIALSNIVYSVLVLLINSFPSKKLVDYRYIEQIKDLLPAVGLSLIMAFVIYPVSFLGLNDVIQLGLQVVFGIVVYVTCSRVFKVESYEYLLDFVKKMIKR